MITKECPRPSEHEAHSWTAESDYDPPISAVYFCPGIVAEESETHLLEATLPLSEVQSQTEEQFTDEQIEEGAMDDVIVRVALARLAMLSDEPKTVRERAARLAGLVEQGNAELVRARCSELCEHHATCDLLVDHKGDHKNKYCAWPQRGEGQ